MSSFSTSLFTKETPILEGHLRTDHKEPTNSASCHFVRDPHFTALITVSAKPEIIESPTCVNIEPLSEIMRRLELTSAHIHNVRLASRNARNTNGKLELLEKTVPGDGTDLANAIKGADMLVSVPMKPAKIRDRPKTCNSTGRLEDFTAQEILDLVVFYNDDFGIVLEDDDAARRKKLMVFLTGEYKNVESSIEM